MPARLPDGSSPSDYLEILELMRRAKVLFPDFWPPWIVESGAEEEERETEMNMELERFHWESD